MCVSKDLGLPTSGSGHRWHYLKFPLDSVRGLEQEAGRLFPKNVLFRAGMYSVCRVRLPVRKLHEHNSL